MSKSFLPEQTYQVLIMIKNERLKPAFARRNAIAIDLVKLLASKVRTNCVDSFARKLLQLTTGFHHISSFLRVEF